ncbi:MAG: RecX family transcriptional regulator [Clostridia bacterium]|nr:RecX family transcriptional regulator [Clostridia bacterium]
MGIITSITKQKKGERVNVFLDGEFYCGLDSLTLLKHSLKEGVEIEEELLSAIQIESERQKATDKAFEYAIRYFKPERKVREHLKEKGYVKELIDEIIRKLKDYGYVDDKKYALEYVSINSERKGKNRIKVDLINAGISERYINEALEELDSQLSACLKFAERYVNSHKPFDKNKLFRHLYSKGFGFDDIKRACANLEIDEDE